MKKILSIFCLFIALTLHSFAQKEANIWYFGDYAGLDFNSGSAVPLSNGQLSTNEGCASICDKTTGQILFYTDGITVYNKNHVQMTNGAGLLGDPSSTQSGVIVPKPGSSTLFYIFTADAEVGQYSFNSGKFCYSIVDMSLSGGLGSVTTKNVVLKTNMVEKIAAVRACNGQDIWVIGHEWNSNAFYAYKVTSAGVSAPVISNSGIIHQDIDFYQNAEAIGYMKPSPDGKKIALACYTALNTVQIFNFDNTTGVISNPITDTNFPDFTGYDGPYGISFSPDNSKLYVSVFGYTSLGGTSYVYQYNMNAGSNAAIISSRTAVRSNFSESFGALQLGPNGKLYVAKINSLGSSYLDVINNPNALGAACNYVNNGQFLGSTGLSAFGLPTMIESYLSVPITATLTYIDCSGSRTLSFTDNALNGSISTSWNFGDPASGSSNTSNLQNPTHTFSGNGNFTVTVYFTTACQVDSFKQTITASGGLTGTAGPDSTICSGDFVQVQATGGTIYNWKPNKNISDTASATPYVYPNTTTTYTVTITNSGGCSTTKTVTISVAPSPPVPTITISRDTLYCSYDPSYKSFQWYFNSGLISGATNSYYHATQSGNYNVSVSSENGCKIAVGVNVVITGINSLSSDKSIFISPNPATDKLYINGYGSGNKNKITIYNAIGEVVFNGELNTTNQEPIDIAYFSKGVYLVRIQNVTGEWTGKFVKN